MKKIILTILILATICPQIMAQCYEPSRKEAVNQFKQKKFKSAKSIFQAMKTCPDKPKQDDIDFWINKCNQALSPQTKQEVISFAEKMAKYEEYWHYGFRDGMMAVQKKSDIEAWENGEGSQAYNGGIPNSPKIGFINEKGDLVVKCIYEDPMYYSMRFGYHFSDGMAAVIKSTSNGWGWGYINKQGREVIPFEYVDAAPFGEGLAAVAKENYATGEWYYYFINKKGEPISSSHYVSAQAFSEGLCAVEVDNTSGWGFINRQGQMVIAPQFSSVFNFVNGVAAVCDKNHRSYETAIIDKTGRIVEDWKFRTDYCNLGQIYDYIIDNYYHSGNYDNTFYGIRTYEKRIRKLNDGKWVGDEGVATSSTDWHIIRILGSLYYYGSGIEQDYSMAAKCWSLVAEHDSEAAHKLAICYYNGQGVEQNKSKALDLWKSAAKEDKEGVYCYNVGIMYYNGDGTQQNFQSALEWFNKSKALGYEKADDMITYCKQQLRKLLE